MGIKFLLLLTLFVNIQLIVGSAPTLEDRLLCKEGDEQPINRVDTTERVKNLRAKMAENSMQGYIVPDADAHQSEYTNPTDQRRKYISGFGGTYGFGIILETEQAVWTDGRYFLVADQQLDCQWLLMKEGLAEVPTYLEWIKSILSSGDQIGIDAKLLSSDLWFQFEEDLNAAGISMKYVDDNGDLLPNLIDEIWTDKPAPGMDPAALYPEAYAGESWQGKVDRVRTRMTELNVEVLLVSALDEVTWLLNLRGNDIPYNPVFMSYMVITMSEVRLYTDEVKVSSQDVKDSLGIEGCVPESVEKCVQLFGYDEVFTQVKQITESDQVQSVLIPKTWGYTGAPNFALVSNVPVAKHHYAVSPLLLFKATKNDVQVQGMRNAHLKDAVALISFLAQMEDDINAGVERTEISASKILTEYREQQLDSRGDSFEYVSAFGPNGADIHYSPHEDTNAIITKDSLYLIDSGGHYLDGTTDVTRTVHYGTPTDFQVDMYTRVLQGCLDLMNAVFPHETTDTKIDILARRPLYEAGLDYRHGTGHGVGVYSFVHESPTQVRIYGTENHVFEKGYFLSDEPGYYQDGDFGIRLESILTVVHVDTEYTFDNEMLGFEVVTMVPFEPNLIDNTMLTKDQCEKLNSFNNEIRTKVGPLLASNQLATDWMMTRTEPISCIVHF